MSDVLSEGADTYTGMQLANSAMKIYLTPGKDEHAKQAKAMGSVPREYQEEDKI